MSNFEIGTRFRHPKKKVIFEIFGEQGFSPDRTFSVIEVYRPEVEEVKISEQELEAKLRRVFIEILKPKKK